MGIPVHLTCLLRNLYAGQETTVRTGHWTTDYLQIGKGVRQGCILSLCLFNWYECPYIKTHPIKNLPAMKASPQMLTENNNKLSLYYCSSGFIMCPKCSLVPIQSILGEYSIIHENISPGNALSPIWKSTEKYNYSIWTRV